MYCVKCGHQIEDNAKFCPYCGSPQSAARTAPSRPANQPSYQNPPRPNQGNNVPRPVNQPPYQQYPAAKQGDAPGHGKAVASLVLGIIGVVFWFLNYLSVISVILGIIGLILAGSAKKDGNLEGVRTAGFVLSLISLIGGAIVLIACVACASTLVGASMLGF